MISRILDGKYFEKIIAGGAMNLRANTSIVNDLNVFPIPDGDTGENMSLTIFGGLKKLKANSCEDLSMASKTLADGMLLSARGNSGVILSQFFAGIAKGLENVQNATSFDVASALTYGVKEAYSAVINPTEGTILTVASDASKKVNKKVTEDSSLEEIISWYLKEAKKSLENTPNLLAVLKDAGVVDSGGAGLVYILEGMYQVIKGKEFVFEPDHTPLNNDVDYSLFNEDSVMEFGYCTEFLLQLQKSKVDLDSFDINELVSFLEKNGNSIVAFRTGSIIKVHVHTFDPGTILKYCQNYGEFLTLKIENMSLQHNETIKQQADVPKTKKKYATISVASGLGIINTFKELGSDVVIDGGQTNNPSTEDFINAFEEANAENIFVFPNNSNIILSAKQAALLCKTANVHVIESKNIGEGYAALTMLNYDFDNVELIIQNFNDAMAGVVTGEVTISVRDAVLNDVSINKNDYIGFSGKTMLSSGINRLEIAIDLLDKIGISNKEVLIMVYGTNVNDSEKDDLIKAIKQKYHDCEIYEIASMQNVYNYFFILE